MKNRWVKFAGGAILIIAAIILGATDSIPNAAQFAAVGLGIILEFFGVKQND